MTDARCDEAFPDLFKEIDRAVEVRQNDHITFKEIDSIKKVKGYMRAMIYDQQVGQLLQHTQGSANKQALCPRRSRKTRQPPGTSNPPRDPPRNHHLPGTPPRHRIRLHRRRHRNPRRDMGILAPRVRR
jgi:hypothetical protein